MFESLDYLYLPAPDIDASIKFDTETLGGELLWRVRDGSTWVAAVRLAVSSPTVLLASHLERGSGLLVYRVKDLEGTERTLAEHGWSLEGGRFEIPQGPCIVFKDAGGQRLAAYQLTRSFMTTRFEGRFDR